MAWDVAVWPPHAGWECFDWRVSIARITQSGPFSGFPGVDRVFVALDGAGVCLRIDGRDRRVALLDPVSFDGEAQTSCVLDGSPVRALNVMSRRGRCRAEVEILAGPATPRSVPDASDQLLVALDDGLVALPGGSAPVGLERWDSVRLPGSAEIAVAGSGRAARITIGP